MENNHASPEKHFKENSDMKRFYENLKLSAKRDMSESWLLARTYLPFTDDTEANRYVIFYYLVAATSLHI